jgi:hypothetical protein
MVPPAGRALGPTGSTVSFAPERGRTGGVAALCLRRPLGQTRRLAQGVDEQVAWDANPEADLAGYEIVWRNSTSPLWQHSRRVGDVTEATIENLNKDDNQVGVRAIDEDGNRSPVAFAGR